MIINIFCFLFLFFLYFSNVSSILSIYPILFNLIKYTSNEFQWYYFGITLALYELGKFFSISFWKRLSKIKSKIFLVLISLVLILILNLSFCFISKLFHILILRFLLGFFNHTGAHYKSIYIQMGFKKNITINIFLITIISSSIALFLPSIIIHFNLGEKILKTNLSFIKFKNIMIIYICFAISNLLAIIFCVILINKKKIEMKSRFYQMANIEKTENSIEEEIKQSNIIENDQKSKSKIIKVNNPNIDTNINIINQNKVINDSDNPNIKSEKSSDNKNYSIDESLKKNNIYNNNRKYKIFIKSKEIQFCFIHTLIVILDNLSMIWTLIILYYQFQDKCLTISIYLSILKIFGEIILFPINGSITKKYSGLWISNQNIILNKMKIINIFLLIVSISISQLIFSIYYYQKYEKILTMILFGPLLIRTILGGILTQLYKIYNTKYLKQNNVNEKELKIYNQYSGSITKSIIYILGSFGILIIELLINKSNTSEIIFCLIYFQLIPQIIYIILFIAIVKYLI